MKIDRYTQLIFFLVLVVTAGAVTAGTGAVAAVTAVKKDNGGLRTMTDLDDQTIRVPETPKRIALLHGPSLDRLYMLSTTDVIALSSVTPTPWACRMIPGADRIPVKASYINVDVEQMLEYRIDLVLYSIFPAQADKLRAAGINVACPFSEKKRPRTMADFKTHFKAQVLFFGDILGKDAVTEAAAYCDYFDYTVDRVLAVTSAVPAGERKTVYYGGLSQDLFSTQGKNSLMQWCVQAGGGIFLTQDYRSHFATINAEQLIAWNPDVIFIGRIGDKDRVKDIPGVRDLKAVRNGRVYKIPQGTFWWDLASGESVLLPLFIATKLYPERFRDWDIIDEMKNFYSRFYDYTISDAEARAILQALPPGQE